MKPTEKPCKTEHYLTRTKLILYLESFFAAWAIMRIGNFHSMNILGFLFFGLSMIFFSTLDREIAISDMPNAGLHNAISGILAIVFTVFYLSDTGKTVVSDLDNKVFRLIILLVVALGLFLILYKGIRYLIYKFTAFELKDSSGFRKIIPYLPFISFAVIVLCRIPWLLYSYPGIMTPDSINQFAQVLGRASYSNHHPWLHTMTISLFYHIGTLFTSDLNAAFAFFTVLQIAATKRQVHEVSSQFPSCPPLSTT